MWLVRLTRILWSWRVKVVTSGRVVGKWWFTMERRFLKEERRVNSGDLLIMNSLADYMTLLSSSRSYPASGAIAEFVSSNEACCILPDGVSRRRELIKALEFNRNREVTLQGRRSVSSKASIIEIDGPKMLIWTDISKCCTALSASKTSPYPNGNCMHCQG